MNIGTTRATRIKLSPVFAGAGSRPAVERRSPTLSGRELRRIVADLIG